MPSNSWYNFGLQGFAEGAVAWPTDTIHVYLIDQGAYTPNLTTHQWLSDIPTAARIAGPVALANKTCPNGILNGDPVTFTGVAGVSIEMVVLLKSTGVATTSRLLLAIEVATGLPFTPNTGNVTINWDTGVNKIAKL